MTKTANYNDNFWVPRRVQDVRNAWVHDRYPHLLVPGEVVDAPWRWIEPGWREDASYRGHSDHLMLSLDVGMPA